MKKRFILFCLTLLMGIAVLIFNGQTANAEADDPASAVMPVNQLIIKYKVDANLNAAAQASVSSQMQRLSATAGVKLTYFRPMSGDAHVLRLPERMPVDQAIAIANQLATLPEVEYAEPDYIMYPMGETGNTPLTVPNDPMYGSQWHYLAPTAGNYGVNAPAAWDITTGSSNVYVAVLDTGITDHVDLSGRWVGGYDMISDSFMGNDGGGRDSDPRDPGDWVTANECYAGSSAGDSSWHGTHVAGTIGAATNNSAGVAGLNWVSQVVPIRVLGKCGGTSSDIADGIRWAAGLPVSGLPANLHPAKVMNLSLGGYAPDGCPATTQSAVDAAYGAGTAVVVAAGNSNDDASKYSPSSCNNVITVAATDRNGDRAYYSNSGAVVEISGPGGAQGAPNDPNGVLSTLNAGTTVPTGDTYEYYQGTSMAAPHVAGVASLMYSVNPSLTPAQVLSYMQNTVTAFPGGSSCNTSICGSGIVNAGTAVAAVSNTGPAAPVLSPISNPDGDGAYTVSWTAAIVTAQAGKQTSSPLNINIAAYTIYLPLIMKNASGTMYTLQEADNAGFVSPTTVHSGSSTSWAATGKAAGTYYYRVMSSNSNGDSTWSNTQSVTVNPTGAPGITNGDFESGSTGWTEFSAHGWDVIVTSFSTGVTPRSGSYAAWLGGDYDEVSYVQQQVTISAGTPYLVYWHWIASEDVCGFDYASVKVKNIVVDSYDLCSSANTVGWVSHSVNLSAYAGQLVTLQIRVETDSSLNSNLFVDDVSLQASGLAYGPIDEGIPSLDISTTQGKEGIAERGE